MRFKVFALPDWRGRCKCRHKRESCHNSKKLGEISEGSSEERRILGTLVSSRIALTRLYKREGCAKSYPHEPRCTPVITISWEPPSRADWISARISLIARLLLAPRASFVTQYVQ